MINKFSLITTIGRYYKRGNLLVLRLVKAFIIRLPEEFIHNDEIQQLLLLWGTINYINPTSKTSIKQIKTDIPQYENNFARLTAATLIKNLRLPNLIGIRDIESKRERLKAFNVKENERDR